MVSEIIGEMLKLSIVVMLVSVLAVSVYAYLPDERIPYAEIMYQSTDGNITLIHAGGDPLPSSDVSIVIVVNKTEQHTYQLNKTWVFSEPAPVVVPLPNATNVSEIMVVHRRAVIYKGEPGWQNA
jgi:FlaG/FlaF family flagellin (archaellin)